MNRANDLFLLLLNLSQMRSQSKIVDLFVECLDVLFAPLTFHSASQEPADDIPRFPIATRTSSYGFLIPTPADPLTGEKQSLLHNAIQMLAIVLERLELEQRLEAEKSAIERLATERLNELLATVDALRRSRNASLNLVEDLSLEIIEHNRAEEALRASEKKYRTLVENLSSGLVVHRPDTSILFSNEASVAILGLSDDQMLGKTAMDPRWCFLQEDRSPMPLEAYPVMRVIATGEGFKGHVLGICRPDLAEPVWVLCNGHPVKDENNQLVQVVITFIDITGSKRAAEALQQSEEAVRSLNLTLEARVIERTAQLAVSNQELEAFSYSVSHDLRAPLRAIDGFSAALLEDFGGQLEGTALDYLRRIRAGSQRMATLIDDLLNLSREARAPMRRERVNITALVQEIGGELQAAEPSHHPEWSVAPDLSAAADARMLRVALTNLLGNAWKFTGRRVGARIEVGILAAQELACPVAGRALPGGPVFFVRDNGAGFEMAHADKLFGAFQRLHSQQEFDGTGIGLALVRRIIRRHGGDVWAEGKVNEGATFFFTLEQEQC